MHSLHFVDGQELLSAIWNSSPLSHPSSCLHGLTSYFKGCLCGVVFGFCWFVTPRAGSLFTSAPKKSDSKYSGSSGGKMESYIPNCPQLEIKDSGRRHEINTWLSFRERFGSWLCLLDECYAAELQEAVTTIEQGKLAPEAAVRSGKLYHWMKQAMSAHCLTQLSCRQFPSSGAIYDKGIGPLQRNKQAPMPHKSNNAGNIGKGSSQLKMCSGSSPW